MCKAKIQYANSQTFDVYIYTFLVTTKESSLLQNVQMMISELNPKHIHKSINPISSLPPFIIMIVMYGIYIKPNYLLQKCI